MAAASPAAAECAAAAAPAPAPAAAEAGITEEELLAISAALAAYLGVRAHIRQIRLVQHQRLGATGPRVASRRRTGCKASEAEVKRIAHETKYHIDSKTYEVEVEVAEPESPAATPRTARQSNHRVGAAARPPAPAPSRRRRTPAGERREGLPQPGFGHRGARRRPAGPDAPGRRHAAGAGSHEDGDQDHGAGRRQSRRHQGEARATACRPARLWWSLNNECSNWNRFRDFCSSIMWPFR